MPDEKPVRILLNKRQWTAVLRQAKPVKTLPRRGLLMMYIPDPDGGAEGIPFCAEEGPDTVCKVGFEPQPGGDRVLTCQCRPRKPVGGGGGGGGGGPTLPACALVVPGAGGVVRCTRMACRGTCELRMARKDVVGKTVYVTACVCRTP